MGSRRGISETVERGRIMDSYRFVDELKNLTTGKILTDEPMANHTTWRIGGPADVMLFPQTSEEIVNALRLAFKYKIPFYVLGNGSNLLVKDKGIRGLVINTSRKNDVKVEGHLISADAGAMMPIVSRIAADNGLSGLEFAVGIPASVGGATIMNAGAHGSCIADAVREVKVLDCQGEEKTFSQGAIGFRYRGSWIKDEGLIVTRVVFSLEKANPGDIKAKMNEFIKRRIANQPGGKPNAGSVFKNPVGISAGKLIDEAGCKGLSCGGAEVSRKHANFILNINGASAKDVLELIERVKEAVNRKFNIQLELEVQILGE